MPRKRTKTKRLEAELDGQVNHSSLNKLGTRKAEWAKRLRRRGIWRFAPLFVVLIVVLGATNWKQPSVVVRVTIKATSGQITMRSDEQVALGASGNRITLNEFELSRSPAELKSVLQPRPTGHIDLEAAAPKGITLERVTLLSASTLTLSSDAEYVSLLLQCADRCTKNRVRLVAFGELRSGSATASIEVPSSIEFAPRTSEPWIGLVVRDSIGPVLVGPVPVAKAVFHESRLLGRGNESYVGTVSAIHDGNVTLSEYPKQDWPLARGDELYVAGNGLRLAAVEQNASLLTFTLEGEASELSLRGKDLRPTWWDWLSKHKSLPVLVGVLLFWTALLPLWDKLKGPQK